MQSVVRTAGFAAVIVGCMAAAGVEAASEAVHVQSPDAQISVTVETVGGVPRYRVQYRDRPVIDPSRLGLVFADSPAFDGGFEITGVERTSVDTVWTQPWGEEKDIRDRHNALRIRFDSVEGPPRTMTVAFRVFDDGLGFRYEVPAQEALGDFRLMDEVTEFAFHDNLKAWWIPAFRDNRYEYQYAASSIDAIVEPMHTPVTLEGADYALSLHEAALVDYASMALKRPAMHGQTLKAELVPWADGVKVYGAAPLTTPWRTIQIADQAYDLANSRLILNLNAPNRLGDVSWARPGKYVGIWWCMHIRLCTWGRGPGHGATTERARRYIDFAAAHGFDGVLIEGWNTGWDGNWYENGHLFDFTEPTEDFDLEALAAYAREKGVAIIGHHETGADIANYERQMEAAFALNARYGMRAVKTGYVGTRLDGKEWHHGQFMVRHFGKVIETAARYRIAIDAHEPIKDTGLRRTWPNMMTREGARGGEYDAWSHAAQGNHPDHTTILPFTRLLAGPMDYTPGIVDLRFGTGDENGMSTTLAKQLALMVVIYSPLQMAADLPENYEAHRQAFQFIKDVPADWDESVALDGRIGDYFVIARKDRASEDWYLGAVTDEHARRLEVPLGFLEAGRCYRAEIYHDGEGAHWLHDPQPLAIAERAVSAEDRLVLPLAPGGGAAVRMAPGGDC